MLLAFVRSLRGDEAGAFETCEVTTNLCKTTQCMQMNRTHTTRTSVASSSSRAGDVASHTSNTLSTDAAFFIKYLDERGDVLLLTSSTPLQPSDA